MARSTHLEKLITDQLSTRIGELENGVSVIDDKAVSNAALADMTAGTIKGKITENGTPQDLTAEEVRQLLIDDAQISSSDIWSSGKIKEQLDLVSGDNSALSDLVQENTDAIASNDTTTATNTSQIQAILNAYGNPDGVAQLDSNGHVPTSQLPKVAITDVYVVADIAARDALTVETGDIVKVTDFDGEGHTQTYIYDGTSFTDIQESSDVISVNGQTKDVYLDHSHIPTQGYLPQSYTSPEENVRGQFQGIDNVLVSYGDRLDLAETDGTDQAARLDAIETLNTTQDGRLDAVEATDAAQTTRLDDIETLDATQDSRLDAIEIVDGEQTARLDAIDTLDAEQNGRLDAIEVVDADQTSRLDAIETVDGQQTTRLDAIETLDAAQNTRLDVIETVDAEQTTRLDAIEVVDGEQNTRLNSLEVREDFVPRSVQSYPPSDSDTDYVVGHEWLNTEENKVYKLVSSLGSGSNTFTQGSLATDSVSAGEDGEGESISSFSINGTDGTTVVQNFPAPSTALLETIKVAVKSSASESINVIATVTKRIFRGEEPSSATTTASFTGGSSSFQILEFNFSSIGYLLEEGSNYYVEFSVQDPINVEFDLGTDSIPGYQSIRTNGDNIYETYDNDLAIEIISTPFNLGGGSPIATWVPLDKVTKASEVTFEDTQAGLGVSNVQNAINSLAAQSSLSVSDIIDLQNRDNSLQEAIDSISVNTAINRSEVSENITFTNQDVKYQHLIVSADVSIELPASPNTSKHFVIKNSPTSSNTLAINSVNVLPGEIYEIIYDGVDWVEY